MESSTPSLSPDDLIQQADRLRTTAFYVCDRQFAQRLERKAEELAARAEAISAPQPQPPDPKGGRP